MKRAILLLVLLAGLGAGGWYLFRPAPEPGGYQGYVEGYLVFMSAEESGRITELAVESGDRVEEGRLLFSLDAVTQHAQRMEAEARLNQARAQLANLQSAMQRPEQIAVLRAQEERARAQLDYSQSELERTKTLFSRGYTAQARMDQAQAAFDRDRAALAEVQRQIDAGEITGRKAEIRAAEAAVRVAEAGLAQAETRLEKRKVHAPAAAQVQDIYFRVGEVVNAGQPVLALLPPGNRRIRFYVPEPDLATLRLGGSVAVTCDSCPADLTGRISFIAQEAEYTPPVIFSREERAKLVFRVEAQMTGDAALPLGLPVTVALSGDPS